MTTSEATPTGDVGELYDEMAGMIEVMGGNIHVGYWLADDDPTPLLEAINRCTDLVGAELALGPGQHLLDIGCGVAVPATRIAQRTDARITALTNSRWQQQEARRRVQAAGLRGQVDVEYGDAAALEHPNESFDAVLAFESLPHAHDRRVWLREMLRVLRPGGRVVLTEFTREVELTDEEASILALNGLQPPLPATELTELIRAEGLELLKVHECGDNIRRSYPAYFDRLASRREDMVAAYGQERVAMQEQGMQVLLPIYRDKIGYLILTARKPD
jgi:cyclopropane fatty-acyl-phospholipid synthase-like methyltransferase